jgi:LysM repeat protein
MVAVQKKQISSGLTYLVILLALLPASASPLPEALLTPHSTGSGKPFFNTLIAALPVPIHDKIWVRVRQSISVEDLAVSLKLDVKFIAKLNEVSDDHRFQQGDWVVLPSQAFRKIKYIAALDTSELRRTPPLQSPFLVEDRAVVRFGDTVLKIAQRYGLSLQELLRLNPGLETARLVVGSQIRLADSAPGRSRMVLGLKPTSSGGVSWPELPEFRSTHSGVSSIGLVGPFKRNPSAFARFLNSKPRVWDDPSLRTYFYDLYNCRSYPAANSNAMPPSYRCDGGYVSYSDNLGSRRCRLDHVSWSWDKGQSFETRACR